MKRKIRELEIACQIIENRSRQVIRDELKSNCVVDAAFEFPYYPSLEYPWMTIQFRCDPKLGAPLVQAILNQLQILQKNGAAIDEINDARNQQKQNDAFWCKDNYYWLTVFSNYYLWGWNVDHMIKNDGPDGCIKNDEIQQILRQNLSTENYSIFSVRPS